MELTRRDALAALAAAGVVAGGGAVALTGGDDEGEESAADPAFGATERETLVAAAAVLYPSAVDGVASFVAEYARRRVADDAAFAAGLAEATAYLDDYADAWYDDRFAALNRGERDEALRRMGADGADADPAGSDVERVRYYVVDELLFALYASPTGAELAGLENPPGHPGGRESYRRGPET